MSMFGISDFRQICHFKHTELRLWTFFSVVLSVLGLSSVSARIAISVSGYATVSELEVKRPVVKALAVSDVGYIICHDPTMSA